MSLRTINPGQNVPDDVNVIIEIPMNGAPVKYEVDKDTSALHVDRFLGTAMYYPANYGYIPQTLSNDGDPVDVLVLTPVPLLSGSVIRARPIGMLRMTDESGEDAKLLAVPIDKLSPFYRKIQSHEDVQAHVLATIEHFFTHYKDLEEGKWVKVDGWEGPEAARKEILASIEQYMASQS